MPEYVPDNYDRFEEHDAEQERMLRKRPVCDCCGEYIQDESWHRIFDKNICNRCLDDNVIFSEV